MTVQVVTVQAGTKETLTGWKPPFYTYPIISGKVEAGNSGFMADLVNKKVGNWDPWQGDFEIRSSGGSGVVAVATTRAEAKSAAEAAALQDETGAVPSSEKIKTGFSPSSLFSPRYVAIILGFLILIALIIMAVLKLRG